MKILRQTASLILFILVIISSIFNVLYMFDIIGREFVRGGFAVFIAVLFIVSLIGIILKDIRREETVPLNIITPVKEIGPPYVWALVFWMITNGVTLLFKWPQLGW